MRPKKKILLVDADETRLGIQCFVLLQHGYAVQKAKNAREALSAATSASSSCAPFEKAPSIASARLSSHSVGSRSRDWCGLRYGNV